MKYTCSDYRLEMQLLGLKRRLHAENLDPDQREKLEGQIRELEREMGMGKD